jgi:membrane fusion protein (multidrug efflux system)
MAQSFLHSTLFLRHDRALHHRIALVTLPLLAVGWFGWLVFASVTLHAVSRSARFQAEADSHPVDAPVAGLVVATHLELDRRVEAAEVLVELDSTEQRLALGVLRSEAREYEARLLALREELAYAERLREQEEQVTRLREREERARHAEASASARLAEADRRRQLLLFEQAAVSAAERDRADSIFAQREAAAQALGLTADRVASEGRARATDRRAGEERLRHDVAELEGELRAALARGADLEHAVALRRVAAPIAGRLGEVARLRVGQFVPQGERLARVLPDGDVRVVAEFAPADALGRVRAGASARVRLDGFPWTQFGSVQARVRSVAHEVRDGTLRVELSIDGPAPPRIPLEHGLPGSVEIDVERLSPLTLLLRIAGQAFTAERP